MKILGIDPGFGTLGWAVVEHNLNVVDYGAIETSPKLPIDQRLLEIHEKINDIIDTYGPHCVALERLFFAKNTKTALDVAKSIGVVLLTTRLKGLSYNEYTPPQVKIALTGYGRASKDQMQKMVVKIFRLKEIPRPDDAADALAIAACHSFNLKTIKIKAGV